MDNKELNQTEKAQAGEDSQQCIVIGRAHPGYLARNQDVAKVYGLNAGLCSIYERMRSRKDCPQWFLEKMNDMIERSNCLIMPLILHRDELPKTLDG